MAVFDVHEIEAEARRRARRAMEVLDDRPDLRVRQHRELGGESQPTVQDRMAIEDARRRPMVRAGTAVAPRVRELQADQQPVIGAGDAAMLLDQDLAQMGEPALGMRADHELVGIRAPVVTHRDRFTAPDKLRAALPEPPPSADRVLARVAVRRAVPSLHRMDGEAVADIDPVAHERPCQRRIRSTGQFPVARDRHAERIQMFLEVRYIPQASQTRKLASFHPIPSCEQGRPGGPDLNVTSRCGLAIVPNGK